MRTTIESSYIPCNNKNNSSPNKPSCLWWKSFAGNAVFRKAREARGFSILFLLFDRGIKTVSNKHFSRLAPKKGMLVFPVRCLFFIHASNERWLKATWFCFSQFFSSFKPHTIWGLSCFLLSFIALIARHGIGRLVLCITSVICCNKESHLGGLVHLTNCMESRPSGEKVVLLERRLFSLEGLFALEGSCSL